MRVIGCWFGFHQWVPIRTIWVRFHRNMYFADKYTEEGEHIVSKLFCPICKKTQDIQVDK